MALPIYFDRVGVHEVRPFGSAQVDIGFAVLIKLLQSTDVGSLMRANLYKVHDWLAASKVDVNKVDLESSFQKHFSLRMALFMEQHSDVTAPEYLARLEEGDNEDENREGCEDDCTDLTQAAQSANMTSNELLDTAAVNPGGCTEGIVVCGNFLSKCSKSSSDSDAQEVIYDAEVTEDEVDNGACACACASACVGVHSKSPEYVRTLMDAASSERRIHFITSGDQTCNQINSPVAAQVSEYIANGGYVPPNKFNGGFGKVVFVFKDRIQKACSYVIKFPNYKKAEAAEEEAIVDRMMALEALALLKLKHENIIYLDSVICWDTGFTGWEVMLATNYGGIDLLEALGKNENQVFSCRLVIASGLIAGLHYMHEQEVIHGDIKLENILVSLIGDKVESVKFADFGGALIVHKGSKSEDFFVRTIGFSAPELVTDKWLEINETTDVFSLGVTFCYLTKCAAFKDKKLETPEFQVWRNSGRKESKTLFRYTCQRETRSVSYFINNYQESPSDYSDLFKQEDTLPLEDLNQLPNDELFLEALAVQMTRENPGFRAKVGYLKQMLEGKRCLGK